MDAERGSLMFFHNGRLGPVGRELDVLSVRGVVGPGKVGR